MDPLSITASIIAVVSIAGQTAGAFMRLRALCTEMPGRLHALNNEVVDLEVVLVQTAAIFNERACLPATDETAVHHLLEQARRELDDIKVLVERLIATVNRRGLLIKVNAWNKEMPKLLDFQKSIKTIKGSLNIIIGASNSRDMMRVRLDLETLSTVTTTSAHEQTNLRDRFLQGLTEHQEKLRDSIGQSYDQVERRIARVEEMLKAQSLEIQTSQASRLNVLSIRPRPYRRRMSEEEFQRRASPSPARSAGFGVRVTQYAQVCRPGCLCSCHSQQRSTTPGMIDGVLGRLFVGYTGLPMFSPRCDTEMCDKAQVPQLSLEYWFPLGFCWSQIVRLQLGYQPSVGPHMQLSTLRRVSDSAQCVSFALEGNIDGLKALFSKGLASPRDVSTTRGYSLLRWALYGQQYETCKFLVSTGADAQYSPISINDDCPTDKACDIVLRGGLPREVVEVLRCLTEGNDFIENQNFSALHKIVLQLSRSDLEKIILEDPANIDVPDAMGRTALEWAAARGDERSVTLLLSYGADPNTMDRKLNTPLTLAANQNRTSCVRLLLEAGADPDPKLFGGIKFGTPLNCAARNASDPLLLKTLLDFRADVEASNVDMVTPLLHVARSQTASHAMILLEYGANINAMSKDGRTPLTTSIIYNNHGVLRLLLERWFEYSECPRLKGPHLLELVAQYADYETMTILASTSHFRLKVDKSYALGDFNNRVRERADFDEKLMIAFETLLDVIGQEPEMEGMSLESLMESGLFTHHLLDLNEQDDGDSWSPASSEFHDAVESIPEGGIYEKGGIRIVQEACDELQD